MINKTLLNQLFGEYNNIFVTSDNHFGHENIIKFCTRPFLHAGTMGIAMSNKWNAVVNARDVVIHLGDFTLSGRDDARFYLSQLSGNVLFVAPTYHHDKRWIDALPLPTQSGRALHYPQTLCLLDGSLADQNMDITLCHYPLEAWDKSFHGSLHFHGHTHGVLPKKKNRLDVGVDSHWFKPILLKDAARMAAE